LVVVSSSGESPCFFAFPSRYFGSLVLRIFASTLLVLTSFLADFGHLWLSALFLAAGSCCWAFLSACKPSLCCWVPLSLSFRLVCLSLFALAFALALLCAFCCLLLCASPFLCASFFVGPCPCSALGPSRSSRPTSRAVLRHWSARGGWSGRAHLHARGPAERVSLRERVAAPKRGSATIPPLAASPRSTVVCVATVRLPTVADFRRVPRSSPSFFLC